MDSAEHSVEKWRETGNDVAPNENRAVREKIRDGVPPTWPFLVERYAKNDVEILSASPVRA